MRIARVGDEPAALRAAGRIEVAERHLDRFGARLAVLAGRPRELQHHTDRDRAIGGVRRGGTEQERREGGAGQELDHAEGTPAGRVLRLYFMMAPWRPVRSRSSA